MATKIFLGNLPSAVSQVTTVQVTNYHADGDYTVTVGHASKAGLQVAITVDGDTDEDGTATALGVAWNASTHPYCSTVTATVATDTVTFTGDTAGVPFTIVSSVTGGDAAIGAATTTIAAQSQHHFMLAANWDDGAAPADNDKLIVPSSAPNICWDLATALNVGTGTSLTIYDGSGKIGLNSSEFATSADAETTDEDAPEYRETYLKGEWLDASVGLQEGGPGLAASPSGRIKIWNEDTAGSVVSVHSVRGTATEVGLPTCRLMAEHANVGVFVYSASGGVGIGVEAGEAATAGTLRVLTNDTAARVYTGVSSQFPTLFEQAGGVVYLSSFNTITAGTLHSGVLRTAAKPATTWPFTTFTINGGTAWLDNGATASVCATTLNGNGGQVIVGKLGDIGTLNPKTGFSLTVLDDETTITTTNKATGTHTISWSS